MSQASSLLPGNQGQQSLFGSTFLSTITGLKSGGPVGVMPTGNPAGFAGQAVGNKINSAINPAPPPAPGGLPQTPNPDNSADDLAAARKRALADAGQGSAADILSGGMGTSKPTVSSNILLGS